MRIENIWLSSPLHHNRFNVIASKLRWWKQLFKTQKIDNTFPQISINGRKVPIVYYSYGSIEIDNSGLTFKAQKLDNSLYLEYLNLDNSLNFSLSFNDMKGVSRYKNSKPYSEKFNYPWISVEMKSGKIFLFSSRIERGKIQEAMEINETIYKNIINNVA